MRSRCIWMKVPSCIVLAAAALSGAAHAQEQPKGQQVFMNARCFACHGEYGFGGVGPRFRQNRFLGMSDYVIGQILVGRGIMPSFAKALDDDQIAAVATYVRTNWGNNFGPVKPQEVAKVRNEVKLRPPQGPHLQSSQASPPGGAQPPHKALPPGEPQPPQ